MQTITGVNIYLLQLGQKAHNMATRNIFYSKYTAAGYNRVYKKTAAFHIQISRELITGICLFPCVQPT